jgi:hypothetical protein
MQHLTIARTLALRLSLCAMALALGAALGRYSNVAKHDLTRGFTPRVTAGAAQHLRASVRYTGRPSAAARTSRLLRAP